MTREIADGLGLFGYDSTTVNTSTIPIIDNLRDLHQLLETFDSTLSTVVLLMVTEELEPLLENWLEHFHSTVPHKVDLILLEF